MKKNVLISKLKSKRVDPHTYDNEYSEGYDNAIDNALKLIERLDVQSPIDKPIVPRFVADWYEENKDHFECSLIKLTDVWNQLPTDHELRRWMCGSHYTDQPITTLVNMHQLGYRVDDEVFHTARYSIIDDPTKGHLNQNKFTNEIFFGSLNCDNDSRASFTKDELCDLNIWFDDCYEIKEFNTGNIKSRSERIAEGLQLRN